MRVGAVITCECGFEARAADEEGLIAEVRRHAAEAHCMPLSHEEALLLVFHAELAAQPTTPRETTDHRGEEEQ
jgi:predicted small metal-binding protein